MPGTHLLEGHRIDSEPIWEAARLAGDGYDRMDVIERRTKWHAVASWGGDGYDLGNWPYVMFFIRTNTGPQCTADCTADCGTCKGEQFFDFATNVEGDTDIYRYKTRAERNEAIDQLAFWYWKSGSKPWVEGKHTYNDLDHTLRGPYGKQVN